MTVEVAALSPRSPLLSMVPDVYALRGASLWPEAEAPRDAEVPRRCPAVATMAAATAAVGGGGGGDPGAATKGERREGADVWGLWGGSVGLRGLLKAYGV